MSTDNTGNAEQNVVLGQGRADFAKDYLMVDGKWADHILTAKTNSQWHLN